ncbi:hypothetical protein LCGC14_0919360 [marine sediment metagenome]|uniref:SRCR domain-containing protein n=1 Tax=marine sediment metagenome TaxID=412755 RepID=A0A0F9NRF1_9ZZZZ
MKNWNFILIAMLLAPLGNCGQAIGTAGIDADGAVVENTAVCGNGTVEANEECDGNPVNEHGANMCKQLGFDHGAVGCYANCTISTSKCIICGDDSAEGLEPCDGEDLRYTTCQDLGYAGGTLACRPGCFDFDESRCANQ